MGNSAFQKIRLLKVHEILSSYSDSDNAITTADIIYRLSEQGIYATRKTIYEDIKELNQFGYYVETCKGKSNSYYLDDRQFDPAEIKVLMSSVRASHFLSESNTRNLLDKLASLESKHQGQTLLKNCYAMGESKTPNKAVIYHISALDEAISNNHKVSFVYTRYNDKGQRVPRNNGEQYIVNPITLLNSDNNFYLIANTDDCSDLRVYRVDRMLNVDELAESKEYYNTKQLHNMHKKMFSMHMGTETQCVLEIDRCMTDIMVDRFGSDTKFVPIANGKLLLTVSVYMSAAFVAWCIKFGNLVKVLSPSSVVDSVRELVSQLASQYS